MFPESAGGSLGVLKLSLGKTGGGGGGGGGGGPVIAVLFMVHKNHF